MAEDRADAVRNEEISVYAYRWVVIAVFALLNAVVQLNWIAFAPITGQAALFYGVSELKIGLLSMSFMIVYIVMCLPASYLLDSLGIRMGIGIGAALTGVFGLLRGFYASNYTVVMISQFGLALGQPFVMNAITAVGASWFPVQERATAAGIPVLAQFVGIIIAMALTPLLTSAHGITGMLLSYGIVSGALALLFCVFMKEKPPTPPTREGAGEHFRFFEGIRDLFRNRDMLFMLLLFFIGLGMFNAVTTWIEQIVHPRGFTAEQAGMVGAIMMFAGIVGAIVFPVFSDRLRKRKSFLILAMAGSIPGLAGIAFAQNFSILALSAAVFGLFLMSAGPIGYQYSAEISAPVPESTSQGLIVLAGQVSGIIFIFGMDALKNTKTGDMTTFMIIFIVLSFLNLFISTRLKESEMIKQ
ncbi:MAG: MFS transporter [Deltaproteobacteria bacterium]|nr:MFS transporter [Deltaproteobacteria bacterium]